MTLTTKRRGPISTHCLLAVALLLMAGVMVGCNRSRPTSDAVVKASPSPTPTPRPQQAVRAQADKVRFTMTDVKGQTIAVVNARTTNFDPLSGGGTLSAEDGDAILYEDGKPATRIRAQKISADRDSRIVTATGNVRAESLSRKDNPTVRADRMVWTADTKVLTGDGKVMLTAKPDFQYPGSQFRADTKLNKLTVLQDERLAQGSL